MRCPEVSFRENFRGREITGVRPLVYSSAWTAADGTKAYCFVNAHDGEVAFSWRTHEGVWRDDKIAAHELRLVKAGK